MYLVSNEIGKTVEELSEQNQELFERLRTSQVYINDVYYIREDNSNLAWVLGASSVVETSLPSRADKPGIGVFQDIVQHLSKPNKQRQVWVVGSDEDWGFASACKGMYSNMDVRFVPVEMVAIAVKLCVEGIPELVCA